MAMRSSDFPELLDTPLRKIFFLSLENSRPEYQRWINIVETKRPFEDDLRMAEFGSIPQGLPACQRNLFEVQAYNILNNSTSAATTRLQGFDGLALLSTAHPNLGNPDTQANKPTSDALRILLAAASVFHTF